MFNSHLNKKNQQLWMQQFEKQEQQLQWSKRYKTQIQPMLVSRYNRRISGFAKKMEDEPVVIHGDRSENNCNLLKSGQTRNLSNHQDVAQSNGFSHDLHKGNRFRLRDSQDWNSIFTPMERANRQTILKQFIKQKQKMDKKVKNSCMLQSSHVSPRIPKNGSPVSKLTLFRSIFANQKYQKDRFEYRDRSKQKQINPPMRYTDHSSKIHTELSQETISPNQGSVSASATLSLPQIMKSKKKNSKFNKHKNTRDAITEMQRGKKHSLPSSIVNAIANQDHSPRPELTQNQSYAGQDLLISAQQSRAYNPEKTQLQLIEEQEMKALAQKRLYFKSLIELQQHTSPKNMKQKHNLKDILVKCGVWKQGSSRVYLEEEVDRFMEMMKTRY